MSGAITPDSLPPLSEYKAWFDARPATAKTRDRFTPDRYRRIARMKAAGELQVTIALAQGVSANTVQNALKRLPKRLGGEGE